MRQNPGLVRSRSRLMATRLCRVLEVVCCSAVIFSIVVSSAGSQLHAAGCHYIEESAGRLPAGVADRLVYTEGGAIAKLSQVGRIYDGGNFHYFPLSSNAPCRGPQCRGQDAPQNFSSASIQNRIRNITFFNAPAQFPFENDRGGNWTLFEPARELLRTEDIFHPPRNA